MLSLKENIKHKSLIVQNIKCSHNYKSFLILDIMILNGLLEYLETKDVICFDNVYPIT